MPLHEFRLPPGLRDLANEVGLTEAQVTQYAQAWDTIRGHRPKTLAEWLPFYEATKQFLKEGEPDVKQLSEIEIIQERFQELLMALKQLKPNDRSDQDRYWAITTTDTEKAYAVFQTFVAGASENVVAHHYEP